MKIYQQNYHTSVFQVADNGFVLGINGANGWLKLYDPDGKVIGSAHSNSYDFCEKLRIRFLNLHGEGCTNIHPCERLAENFDPLQKRSLARQDGELIYWSIRDLSGKEVGSIETYAGCNPVVEYAKKVNESSEKLRIAGYMAVDEIEKRFSTPAMA